MIDPKNIVKFFKLSSEFAPESNAVWLSDDEMLEVFQSADLGKKVVAVKVNPADKTVTVMSGTKRVVELPFAFFEPSGTNSPDFTAAKVIDYGNTVAFGEYEAAADVVLS